MSYKDNLDTGDDLRTKCIPDFDSDAETLESLSLRPRSIRPTPSSHSVRPLSMAGPQSLLLDPPYSSSPEQLPSISPAHLPIRAPTRTSATTLLKDRTLVGDADHDAGMKQLSAFESLPTELLLQVAFHVSEDKDLSSLVRVSPIFSSSISPELSDIWKKRFLARYDYPLVQNVHEYAAAYKLRRFITRKFDYDSLSTGDQIKATHQLLVVKDMLLESYNREACHLPYPSSSRNLAAMASPDTSPWILELMRCPLYAHERVKYGQPNSLFDSIHIALSHLVLNPRSSVLLRIPSSRDQYDLAVVYQFNKPAAMILSRLSDRPQKLLRSSRFPNLTSAVQTPKLRYTVDLFSVLHVRNFWQRHFCDSPQGIGENTYSSMMQRLVAMNKAPQKWNQPLQEPCMLHTRWLGHYSCLHPWPKDRQDLEERQSCAEDWRHVDPMKLEFETRTGNDAGTFWPPLFSNIPIFSEALPQGQDAQRLNLTYLRGIAKFLDLQTEETHPSNGVSDQAGNESQTLPKWHPFLSSRMHGFVHDIPSETLFDNKSRKTPFSKSSENQEDKPIPGWKRVVMVLYKPSLRQLVSVLEHAEEDFGGPGDNFNTAAIWDVNQPTQSPSGSVQGAADHEGDMCDPSTVHQAPDDSESNDEEPTEAQIEARMQKMLAQRIKTYTESYEQMLMLQTRIIEEEPVVSPYKLLPKPKPRPKALPPLFSAAHIRELEESFSSVCYMSWDDGTIEYAYAYEGIITPGGNIMLGRYWRTHGVDGMGSFKETGPDGVGVEVRPSQEEEVEEEAFADDASDAADADYEDETTSKNRRAKADRRKQQRKRKAGATTNITDTSGKKRKKLSRSKSNAPNTEATTKPRPKSKSKTERSFPRRSNQQFSSYSLPSTSDDDEDALSTEYESLYPSSSTDTDSPKPCPSYHQRHKKQPTYEFVTMYNGNETRAVNGCKGLERGPFVFWAV